TSPAARAVVPARAAAATLPVDAALRSGASRGATRRLDRSVGVVLRGRGGELPATTTGDDQRRAVLEHDEGAPAAARGPGVGRITGLPHQDREHTALGEFDVAAHPRALAVAVLGVATTA